jgi:hypothetical protein
VPHDGKRLTGALIQRIKPRSRMRPSPTQAANCASSRGRFSWGRQIEHLDLDHLDRSGTRGGHPGLFPRAAPAAAERHFSTEPQAWRDGATAPSGVGGAATPDGAIGRCTNVSVGGCGRRGGPRTHVIPALLPGVPPADVASRGSACCHAAGV